MADRILKLRDLKRILKRYEVDWSESRGKGSHMMFFRQIGDRKFSYPIPTHGTDVNARYVAGIRKALHLTSTDGISDKDFYEN